MGDRDSKKLIFLIYIISFATLVLIAILSYVAISTNAQVNQLKQSVYNLENTPKIIPKDGKDSISVHTVEKIIKQVPIPGKQGKAGESVYQLAQKYGFIGTELDFLNSLKGKNAPPARLQETWVDPETCVIMTRYQGDDYWTMQAQLPKPCEVL